MNRRILKKKVLQLFAEGQPDKVVSDYGNDVPANLINPLFSALCAPSDIVRWNSVSCFGMVVPRIADDDIESARIIMRRLIWSLNDESGGIGWGAPEAMAEIMYHHDELADEYLHMLVSYLRDDGPELFQDGNYLELPMLQRGLLWGIGRLCETRRASLLKRGVSRDIHHYLHSEDMVVRGLAVWCLTCLGDGSAEGEAAELPGRDTRVPIFKDGHIKEYTLGELVDQYVKTISQPE